MMKTVYLVLDCSYNREYYPGLIGMRLDNPPTNAIAVPRRQRV